MNQYTIGSVVQISCLFTNISGAPADPSAVTAECKLPDTSTVQLIVTRVSTGAYTAQIPVTQGGNYEYRFAGTGALQAAMEGAFFANSSAFTS